MQRLRLTSHLHFGLALGIATASVVLALSGCATTTAPAKTAEPVSATPAAALEQFSEAERARILSVQDIVAKAAAEHQLDPALLNAMIWVESRFEPKAKSPSGARGLMQLMPATAAYLAKRMGEASARAYDPEFNVRAGALYLAEMLAKFGDETRAVAAYHAGPGNVNKWVTAGQPFPSYSEAYVAKVMDARARFVGVETHGRTKTTRVAAAAVPRPAPARADDPDDPGDQDGEDGGLIVPDVDTLPDAAQIHGIAAVAELHAERPSGPVFEPEPELEPVFEVHPELDRDRDSTAPGWATATVTSPAKAPATPAPRPKPAPAPAPAEEEIGLGVLPDL